MECCCQDSYGDLGEGLLDTFASVRECCPALKQILVPDKVWPTFQKWDGNLADGDLHRSILLLAMERGCLGRVTSAIHRYLIQGGLPATELTNDYRSRLQEQWMKEEDPIERNNKSKVYFGSFVELQCAEWLESQGWTISGLTAFGAKSDIIAYTDGEAKTAFEVKFIGREGEDFVLMLNSQSGTQPTGRWVSRYSSANFLLFRAYEAAKQLQRTECRRIALLDS